MNTDNFIKESEAWVESLGMGYQKHSSTLKSALFLNFEHAGMPAIRCFINASGDPRMEIFDNASYKFFLKLTSNEIQWKHPDAKKYIQIMKYYGDLALTSPPF